MCGPAKFSPHEGHQKEEDVYNQMIGQFVICRGSGKSGVNTGVVEAIDADTGTDSIRVMLTNSSRIWSWRGSALDLTVLAAVGPGEGSRISRPVEWRLVTDCCELLPVNDPEVAKRLSTPMGDYA